jgi:hypothetical protein
MLGKCRERGVPYRLIAEDVSADQRAALVAALGRKGFEGYLLGDPKLVLRACVIMGWSL